MINFMSKANLWTSKIKDLNREKIKGQLYEMSYYSKPDSHIRDKVKVELEFSIYATKKN